MWVGFNDFPHNHFQIWKLNECKNAFEKSFSFLVLLLFYCNFEWKSDKLFKKKSGIVTASEKGEDEEMLDLSSSFSFYSRKSCNLIKLACNLENVSCVLKKQLFALFRLLTFTEGPQWTKMWHFQFAIANFALPKKVKKKYDEILINETILRDFCPLWTMYTTLKTFLIKKQGGSHRSHTVAKSQFLLKKSSSQ